MTGVVGTIGRLVLPVAMLVLMPYSPWMWSNASTGGSQALSRPVESDLPGRLKDVAFAIAGMT